MSLKQNYDSLLIGNTPLFDDRDYQGYLEKESRQSTSKIFLRIGEDLAHIKDRLERSAGAIAKEHSIETFKEFDEILENLNQVSGQFLREQEYTFYQISEVHLRGCITIIQLDRDLVQSISAFQTEARQILNGKEITEQAIRELGKRCRSLVNAATRRLHRIQELGENFRNLEEAANQIGKLIDERDLDEARHFTDIFFEQSHGFLKPYLDLIEQFKGRKLFHTRRIDTGMYRDDQSLKFFDLYVDVLSHLNQILDQQSGNVELSPYKDKAIQEASRLSVIHDQRDELYSQAAPRESEEDDRQELEELGASARSKISLIAIITVIILVVLIILLIAI